MIDEKATKKNVKQLLERYHNFRRLSGIPIEQIKDSNIEQLPNIKCSKGEELTVNLQRAQQAQMIFKSIFEALKKLPNHNQKKIEQRYIVEDTVSNICSEEMLSKTTFYRCLDKAMIEFAEIYNDGELLVFEKKR